MRQSGGLPFADALIAASGRTGLQWSGEKREREEGRASICSESVGVAERSERGTTGSRRPSASSTTSTNSSKRSFTPTADRSEHERRRGEATGLRSHVGGVPASRAVRERKTDDERRMASKDFSVFLESVANSVHSPSAIDKVRPQIRTFVASAAQTVEAQENLFSLREYIDKGDQTSYAVHSLEMTGLYTTN